MKFFNLLLFSFFVISTVNSQTIFVDTDQNINDDNILLLEKNIPLENSFVTEINLTQLESDLTSVPMEKQHDSESWGEISLPFPDGSFRTVKIEEAPVFEQAMNDAYPQIKSYRITGKYISGRVAVTPQGLDGLIFADDYSFFIEPLEGDLHVSYKMSKSHTDKMSCGVTDAEVIQNNQNNFTGTSNVLTPLSNGADLREYRIAIASTNEFSDARGNDLTTINTDINTYLMALNALYEKELSIVFTLISNNDLIVFNNPAVDDGIDPSNSNTQLTTTQSVINSTIGSANYDIGHAFYEIPSSNFNTGFSGTSGVASVGIVCSNNSKARGWTGAGASTPTNYSLALFLGTFGHEIGHQFSARHSYYGTSANCNQRSPGSGYEPGSGSSIMSYEGSCFASGSCTNHNITPEVSTVYFHVHSLDQIINYATNAANCLPTTSTGNNLPVVTVPANTTIPKGTPFELVGSATDGDGDPLVYIWEQYDTDNLSLSCPAGHPNDAATSTTAPLFRSFDPSSTGAARTFPQLSDILANSQTQGEIMAQVSRTLHFKLTARDFRPGGGGIDYEETEVVIDGNSGPFEVLTGNTSTGYSQGSSQLITWDVAGTNASPVNCGTVNILFSTDGGQTFPTTLASGVTNNGSATITVPSTLTSEGRIKIECANNIFFDINNVNIAVVAGCAADAQSISNDDSVSEEAGTAALDLSIFSGIVVNSTSGEIVNGDPNSNLAVEDNGGGTCVKLGNNPRHKLFSFTVDRDEDYTFAKGSGTLSFGVLSLYEDSFDPSLECTNWLASNANYPGPPSNVSVSNSVTSTLVKGKQYILVISGFSTSAIGPYNINITSSGTGQVFDNSNFPASGYENTYVIVNNTTGNIVAFDAGTDLSNGVTYPAESYTIHGVVVLGGTDLSSYVGTSFVNTFQAAINSSTICADLSTNNVAVTIVPNALPIELLSFIGKQQNESIFLNWKTSSEENNDFFTLEHSIDGYEFEFLAEVDGKGNSTITTDYRFIHENPTVGTNYYRLSQTDFDGTTKEADVIAVDYKSDKIIATVVPNPIRQHEINLNYISPRNSEVEIEVIDMTGKVLIQTTISVSEGENNIQLPAQNWASGVYYLRTIQNQTIKSIKFVKTN